MDTLSFLFSDYIWFWILEIFIAIVFIRSVIYYVSARRRKGGTGAQVARGEKSWGVIFTFWGISIILVEIIISSDLISDHRVIIGLMNVAVLFYLIIVSPYFKNKIIGWHMKLSNWFQ